MGSGQRGNDAAAKKISTEELRQNTDWIAIDGQVYNVKAFAPHHPGGELIRAMGGTDCSALFRSMHPHSVDRNLTTLQAWREEVELLPRTDLPKFNFDTAFAKDLKRSVAAAMGNKPSRWYAPAGFWLRTAMIAVCTLAFEYYWATSGVWFWGVLTGFCHALIGLAVQHDASHGAFSSNPTINAIFSYGADWIGNSRWLWLQQHVIGHHPHTNIEGHDPDAHSAEPVMLFHDYNNRPDGAKASQPNPQKWFHVHQWWYMFVLLPWYGPSLVADMKQLMGMRHGDEVPPNAWTLSQRPFAIATRLFYVLRVLAAPYFIGGASLAASLLIVPLCAGAVLTFLFVVSHNFEGSDRYPALDEEVDWYKLQAETSCSYGGNLAMFWSGGLNMQIEHHLFPRMSSWYYPQIAPVVRAVCEKHGVKYTSYPSLLSNLKSTINYMRTTGGWKALAHHD